MRRVRSAEEYRLALGAVAHYFGFEPTEEDIERFGRTMPQERVYAALTEGRVVGGAGSFPIDLSVPGGTVACAAVSIVGVLPSDRRRGVLRRMMDMQLRDVRAAGEPLAALWASEETIYGRFGYGLAALSLMIDADRHRVRIAPGLSSEGRVRLVDTDEALRVFPRVYERVRRGAVGHLSRAPAWWEHRRLGDRPDQRRGAGPLNRALLERAGAPVGYALYRISQSGSSPADWKKTVRVIDAVGIDPAATRDIWRFLFEIDWTDRVEAFSLPLDHPLLLLADRLTELGATVWDGLWLRLLDVDEALRGRAYGAGRATVEVVSDGLFPENVGRWTIADGAARRSRSRPDVQLPVEALGAVYLGGFSVRELVRAGRATEAVRGGAARLDAVLGGGPYPWCPEVF